MRLSGKALKWIAVALVSTAVLGVGVWLGSDWLAKKPDRDVVDRYLAAYQRPNLDVVRSLVSVDMAGVLPGTQKVFEQAVASAPNGQIKSWKITSVERNKWVGQSIITATVTTTAKTFNLRFDVFNLPEGRLIRAVSDLNASATAEKSQSPAPNMNVSDTAP